MESIGWVGALRGKSAAPSLARRRGPSRWGPAALLAVVMATAGCSAMVGGTARPASSPAHRSLNGRTIERVLLGHSALSRIVKQPVNIDPHSPPLFGGPEALRGDTSAWPIDCMGVAVMMQPSVYRSTAITNVALQTWRPDAVSATVTRVKEGVISLPTPADAEALFARFSEQWQRCDGNTVPFAGGMFRLEAKISNVQVSTSVVAASISMGFNLPLGRAAIPAGRAIGVRDNCLIEVEVDYSNPSDSSLPGPGDVSTSALDIAQVMRDKVNALS